MIHTNQPDTKPNPSPTLALLLNSMQ